MKSERERESEPNQIDSKLFESFPNLKELKKEFNKERKNGRNGIR